MEGGSVEGENDNCGYIQLHITRHGSYNSILYIGIAMGFCTLPIHEYILL